MAEAERVEPLHDRRRDRVRQRVPQPLELSTCKSRFTLPCTGIFSMPCQVYMATPKDESPESKEAEGVDWPQRER